jgi:hypothetical protein
MPAEGKDFTLHVYRQTYQWYIHFLSNCEIFMEEKVHIDIKIASFDAPRHSSDHLQQHLLSNVQETESVTVQTSWHNGGSVCHGNKRHTSNSGDMTAIYLQTRSSISVRLQITATFPSSRNTLQWFSRLQKTLHKNWRHPTLSMFLSNLHILFYKVPKLRPDSWPLWARCTSSNSITTYIAVSTYILIGCSVIWWEAVSSYGNHSVRSVCQMELQLQKTKRENADIDTEIGACLTS